MHRKVRRDVVDVLSYTLPVLSIKFKTIAPGLQVPGESGACIIVISSTSAVHLGYISRNYIARVEMGSKEEESKDILKTSDL